MGVCREDRISEEEKNNRDKLFAMMQEYPDLPVIPIVDSDIVGEDCGYWIGSWGPSRIEKILFTEEKVFYADDDEEYVLTEVKGWDWYDNATDQEVDKAFKDLPWTKAICVMIDTKDDIPNQI